MKQSTLLMLIIFCCTYTQLSAQRGFYDAPYKRYEANLATLSNGAVATTKSYAQFNLQSEASDQICVNMSSTNATLVWNCIEDAEGLVLRYSVPDGQVATVGIYNGATYVTSLTLTTTWSWESLWNNGNPNNGGISNYNPKMRFDEVRYKLPTKILNGGQLKIVRLSGNLHIDFAELEPVPPSSDAPVGAVTYSGDGSTLQAFIDANGGHKIYLPSGTYNVNRELYFGVANTTLLGAGMWYTQINFTSTTSNNGGLRADAINTSFSDLYLTTNAASRSNSYKAINGVYTATSTIKNIWAEHFECGAWIAQYNTNGPAIADGFTLSYCRFRNNYADGINLCKGTSNAIVEHSNFRNNGDDDQAIWCANGQECINNTFRYNTSENCWRASGVAFYGGKNNKAYNLIIKDNLESGIRLSNNFPGVGFNSVGLNELHDITIISAGTQNDLYNQRVGAIDIFSSNVAGTQVKNVKFSNIDIIDSKCDAILIKKISGDGIYNLAFESITANGTGKEYPHNNTNNLPNPKGFFTAFSSFPNGNGTYCNMNYSNRGGTATTDEYTLGIGSFSWSQAPNCSLEASVFEKNTLLVYPNPVTNELNLVNLEPFDAIMIIDAMGKTMLETTTTTTSAIIQTQNWAKGIYCIVIKGENKVQKSKFIKI